MSTSEERIKQRFRTLADGAALGPDRQYTRRACELLIEALAPELNRIDRVVDQHDERLQPTTAKVEPRKHVTVEKLTELIQAGDWQNNWPPGEPMPLRFTAEKQIWDRGVKPARVLVTRDSAFLRDWRIFIAVSRSPGVVVRPGRADEALTADTAENLSGQVKFGIWGYPFDALMYERVHVAEDPGGQYAYFVVRGSFNHWKKWWPDDGGEILAQAQRALLPPWFDLEHLEAGDR